MKRMIQKSEAEIKATIQAFTAGDIQDAEIMKDLAERPKNWATKYRMAFIGIDDEKVAGR